MGTETTARRALPPTSVNGKAAARSPIRVNRDTQFGVGSEFNSYPHIQCYARSLKECAVIPKLGQVDKITRPTKGLNGTALGQGTTEHANCALVVGEIPNAVMVWDDFDF